MKIVNRGFLIVSPKQPFFDWANQFEEELYFSEDDDVEPTVYLIDDEFIETEPVIQQQFKKIFTNELSMITEDDSEYPPITEENFHAWFSVSAGTTVLDCLKTDLEQLDID